MSTPLSQVVGFDGLHRDEDRRRHYPLVISVRDTFAKVGSIETQWGTIGPKALADVYGVVLAHCRMDANQGGRGCCKLGKRALAEWAGVDRKVIIMGLTVLEEVGLIRKVKDATTNRAAWWETTDLVSNEIRGIKTTKVEDKTDDSGRIVARGHGKEKITA